MLLLLSPFLFALVLVSIVLHLVIQPFGYSATTV